MNVYQFCLICAFLGFFLAASHARRVAWISNQWSEVDQKKRFYLTFGSVFMDASFGILAFILAYFLQYSTPIGEKTLILLGSFFFFFRALGIYRSQQMEDLAVLKWFHLSSPAYFLTYLSAFLVFPTPGILWQNLLAVFLGILVGSYLFALFYRVQILRIRGIFPRTKYLSIQRYSALVLSFFCFIGILSAYF